MMVQFDVKRVQKGTESFMVSFDFTKTPVTQIADYIIMAASHYGTSDIHFDPREEGMMVRFRIDGDCQDYTFIPKAYEKNLVTRLKIMANMNITESRLPQDGAIKGTFGDTYLDMRVSALPLNEGEKVVIRILDYSRSLEGIDTLGFHPNNLEKIRRMMNLPNGIILTTGATGSGKSTTTYSILQGLNKPETNVITVEDPIEMNIEGINQVQVNAEIGMTFAAALRSILRQDPNVILIGEIRDSETAQIAVRASITGHLVLSTIHTNNALSTVERLLDMNVERYLLSTALAGIISQRLAKMLCPDCRYQRDTTKYEKKVFKKFMDMDVQRVWDANPKGCEHCRKGYHGRIAFHEVLEIDESVRNALSNEKLEKKDLAKMVYSGKTITMLQDALIKCLEGITSFEEVYRNIEIENEDDDSYENEMATEIKDSIPVEEEVQVSDDLLETPITKTDNTSVIVPPSMAELSAQAEASQQANENSQTDVSNTTTITENNSTSTESVVPGINIPTDNIQTSEENSNNVVPGINIPAISDTQENNSDSVSSTESVSDSSSVVPSINIPTSDVSDENNSTENTEVEKQNPIINLPSLGEDDGEATSVTTVDNIQSESVVKDDNNTASVENMTSTILTLPTAVGASTSSQESTEVNNVPEQNIVDIPNTNAEQNTANVQNVESTSDASNVSTTFDTSQINAVSENPLGPVTPITLPVAENAVVDTVQQLSNSPFMNQEAALPDNSAINPVTDISKSVDIEVPTTNPVDGSQPLTPTII